MTSAANGLAAGHTGGPAAIVVLVVCIVLLAVLAVFVLRFAMRMGRRAREQETEMRSAVPDEERGGI